MISSVVDSLGKQALEAIAINNTFTTFYENVYKSGPQTDTTEEMNTLFPLFPCLSDDQKTSLEAPISKKEVLSAIKGLQSGKAAGSDGLSIEF